MKREKGKKADQMGKWPGGQKCRKNVRNQAGGGEKRPFLRSGPLGICKRDGLFFAPPAGQLRWSSRSATCSEALGRFVTGKSWKKMAKNCFITWVEAIVGLCPDRPGHLENGKREKNAQKRNPSAGSKIASQLRSVKMSGALRPPKNLKKERKLQKIENPRQAYKLAAKGGPAGAWSRHTIEIVKKKPH